MLKAVLRAGAAGRDEQLGRRRGRRCDAAMRARRVGDAARPTPPARSGHHITASNSGPARCSAATPFLIERAVARRWASALTRGRGGEAKGRRGAAAAGRRAACDAQAGSARAVSWNQIVRQGYELGVTRRSVCDGWARRRGLSLTTPPAARVARGGGLGGFWVFPRRRPLRAWGGLGARWSCGSTSPL